MLTHQDRQRFEAKVDRSGGPDACHPWTGCLDQNGYGRFSVGGRRGSIEKAHRVAWVLAGNKITEEKPCVLHDCPGGDLPACCNDRHLWDGTKAENQLDMARKGRGRKSKRGLPYGVYRQRNGRFAAKVRFNGKHVHIGGHDSQEKAHEAALRARKELRG